MVGVRKGGVEEEPLSPDPLECFAALLRATELRSVELIVVNAAAAANHLKATLYVAQQEAPINL